MVQVKSILASYVVALMIYPAHAENIGDERNMICRGSLRTERVGYCHILFEDDKSMGAIAAKCYPYQPCIVKARVRLAWINGEYKNYEIVQVYKVLKGRR